MFALKKAAEKGSPFLVFVKIQDTWIHILWEFFFENSLLNEMVKGTAGTETGLVNEQGKKEYNR